MSRQPRGPFGPVSVSAAAARRDAALRRAVVQAGRELARQGLSHGTSGNVGVRRDHDSFFLSPTGLPYDSLLEADVPLLMLDGRWFGNRRPSSEWRFHRDIFAARPEVGAIVHTHSRAATALACTGQGIPAFHYMVAIAGGSDIRCAPYRTFGTQALSDAALDALRGRRACLLANHGVIALGTDAPAALSLAAEVENLAEQYAAALTLGEVQRLDEEEMQRVLEKFQQYGQGTAGADAALRFVGEMLPEPSGAGPS